MKTEMKSDLDFVNDCDLPIDISWIDFNCRERVYRTLNPGQRHPQSNYVTHEGAAALSVSVWRDERLPPIRRWYMTNEAGTRGRHNAYSERLDEARPLKELMWRVEYGSGHPKEKPRSRFDFSSDSGDFHCEE